jgi:hypothetical protein
MDWNRIGQQARRWLKDQRTELLTGNRAERDDARRDAAAAQQEISEEVIGSVGQRVAQQVLPEPIAAMVRDHQPEVVAARAAEERRNELAARPRASLDLSVTLTAGTGPAGQGRYELAAEVVSADADEPGSWARIELDADDPAAPPDFGGAPLSGLTVELPTCPGPGRFTLAELAGSTGAELCLRLGGDDGESYLYWAEDAEGSVELAEDGLTFVAALASASARADVSGRIVLAAGPRPWWQPVD